MSKFAEGDTVLVPAAHMADPARHNFALVSRQVLEQQGLSIIVTDDDAPNGTSKVAMRFVHSTYLRFLVLCIGDLQTEDGLLKPLARNIAEFLRLLITDDDRRVLNIRTVAELRQVWEKEGDATTHVVLVGHGSSEAIRFLDDGAVHGDQLGEMFRDLAPTAAPKIFISLACLTGRAAFASAFSMSPICRSFIAPFHSVHGAAAAQFVQNLLTWHLLDGREINTAYRRAAKSVTNGSHFRHWRSGIIEPARLSGFRW